MKNPILVGSLVLLLCFAFGCQNKAEKAELENAKAQAEIEAQNIEVIKKLFAELGKRNAEIIYELYAPDSKYYFPSRISTPISRDDEIAQAKMFFAALPDLTEEVVDIFAIKDRVIARIIAHGTHLADMEGIPPTGNKVEISALLIFRLKDGKVVEEVEEADLLGFYQQLGMELKPKKVKK
jgi:steroid delta-isomerase-like uncharacterized protein